MFSEFRKNEINGEISILSTSSCEWINEDYCIYKHSWKKNGGKEKEFKLLQKKKLPRNDKFIESVEMNSNYYCIAQRGGYVTTYQHLDSNMELYDSSIALKGVLNSSGIKRCMNFINNDSNIIVLPFDGGISLYDCKEKQVICWKRLDCCILYGMATNESNIVACFESSIQLLKHNEVNPQSSSSLDLVREYHSNKLTTCGIVPIGGGIIVGDFTGKLRKWNGNGIEPEETWNITYSAIRSLCLINDNLLLIGTLDDGLYGMEIHRNNVFFPIPQITISATTMTTTTTTTNMGGVISIRKQGQYVMVTYTSGFVSFYQVLDNKKGLNPLHGFLAHPPVDDHHDKDNFGSLRHFAEVWSCSYNPQNLKRKEKIEFITSSEDQSIKMWEMEISKNTVEGLYLKNTNTLLGHTSAVTCVDWILKDLIVSCGDDQTIRIWCGNENTADTNGISFKCLKIIETTEMTPDWHTLTYLDHFNQGEGDENSTTVTICCGSQNGYISCHEIYCHRENEKNNNNLITSLEIEMILEKKVHTGSIEGLIIDKNNNHIYTTSSDCTSQLLKIKIKKT